MYQAEARPPPMASTPKATRVIGMLATTLRDHSPSLDAGSLPGSLGGARHVGPPFRPWHCRLGLLVGLPRRLGCWRRPGRRWTGWWRRAGRRRLQPRGLAHGLRQLLE